MKLNLKRTLVINKACSFSLKSNATSSSRPTLWARIFTPSSATSTLTRLNALLGTCSIKYGYLITIFKIEKIEDGIVNDNGEAVFTVSFKALVFRPLKGEVLDGIVEGVERVGLELSIGCVRIFVPHTVD